MQEKPATGMISYSWFFMILFTFMYMPEWSAKYKLRQP